MMLPARGADLPASIGEVIARGSTCPFPAW